MRKINYIVIHCSAGHGDLESVKKFWKETLGWKTGGYHYWVDYDGSVTQLYDLGKVTNGVRGFNNHSVHICYRGGVEKGNVKKASDTRTDAQKKAILSTIDLIKSELLKTQSIGGIKVRGHRDFSKDVNGNGVIDSWERIKECPSFDAEIEYKNV